MRSRIASMACSKLESSNWSSLTIPHKSYKPCAEATLSSYDVDSNPSAILLRMAEQEALASLGIVDSKLSQFLLESVLIRGSDYVLYLLRNMFGTNLITMLPFSSVSIDSGRPFTISFRFNTLMISSSGSKSARLSKSYMTVLGNSLRILICVPRQVA